MDFRSFIYATVICTWLGGAGRTLAASVDVSDWELGDRISLAGIGLVGAGDGVPTTPFEQEFHTTLSNSSTASFYDVAWDQAGHLDFYVEAEHHCQGAGSTPANAECRSTGSIFFTPQVDSLINFATEYNHALGTGFRTAGISVSLREFGAPQAIVLVFQRNNTLSHPPIDTLSYTSESVPILAGVEYVVNYGLEINSTTGSPDSISHADGYFSMQIAPIPEPITLVLLSAVGPLILVHRSRV